MILDFILSPPLITGISEQVTYPLSKLPFLHLETGMVVFWGIVLRMTWI